MSNELQKAIEAYRRGDYATAFRHLKPLASQGYVAAQYILGYLYYDGLGVVQDHAEAGAWFSKAAEQGHARAQINLALMFEHGLGVPQDYTQAVAWYRKAADQGEALAEFNLAKMYEQGIGMLQDYTQAIYLYQKSASQGYAPAQSQLGALYRDGRGVAPDLVNSHTWFNLAAANSSEQTDRTDAAANRDQVASKMTEAQIVEAQRRAREWRATTTETSSSATIATQIVHHVETTTPTPAALEPVSQFFDDKRVALVVGIGAYTATSTLKNPPNDAHDVNAALKKLGFDSELVLDADRSTLVDAVKHFNERIYDASVALFFMPDTVCRLAQITIYSPRT